MDIFCFDPKFTWGSIIQALGFIGAIWGVSHQLRKQREMQIEKHRNELQVNIYEKITSNIENSSPVGVATTLHILVNFLDHARKNTDKTSDYRPPPFQVEEINNSFKEVHSNLWKMAGIIEKYEIISPNMPLFREVIVIKIRELSEAFIPLIQIMPYVLISEKGIRSPDDLIVPDENDIILLNKKVDVFYEIAFDLVSFLYDIQVETQNVLLGNLFDHRIPIRKPHDEKSLILTSKEEGMLDRIKEYLSKQNIGNK